MENKVYRFKSISKFISFVKPYLDMDDDFKLKVKGYSFYLTTKDKVFVFIHDTWNYPSDDRMKKETEIFHQIVNIMNAKDFCNKLYLFFKNKVYVEYESHILFL